MVVKSPLLADKPLNKEGEMWSDDEPFYKGPPDSWILADPTTKGLSNFPSYSDLEEDVVEVEADDESNSRRHF